ncbi:Crp/Fnr family transcriptional regulator [Pararhizobium sp.]|uniref:Crp/Fnr family transcriptional regulator n=1 Tax=Pararhizobium sp. TaxID=1977563 RepID=UPI0027278FA0|nr:Crp/Fnr family transcriptional regulator [Pararhizobium sp.]MDO9415042.1 Crp/Fnr family transcriptional regulator [Pararhizobium sp.]
MSKPNARNSQKTPCEQCPLRPLPHFREFKPEELSFVSRFKTGELVVDAGATVLVEGSHSAHLFTVLSGWAFRYKMLEDGRRQILNYVMPGDLIGLQGSLLGEMQHSIEALTPVTLCVFERDRLPTVFHNHAELAYDLTWIASREERMLDENLLSIGRRSALERAAYLLAFLYDRSKVLNIFPNGAATLPLTQQHVADTLGLSIVHTNKTLKKLAEKTLIRWADRGCHILDDKGLRQLSGWEGFKESKRPFI